MPNETKKKAGKRSKSEGYGNRSAKKSGLNKSQPTTIFYQLPLVFSEICALSSGSKGLFAVLIFNAWGRSWCRVGMGSMANCLGTDRRSIRRWLRELERRGLIKIRHEWDCCCYYLNPKYRVGPTIPLLAETMKRRDIGQSYKLLLCLLSYRQANNDYCWSKQKDLAENLGLSVRTIQKDLATMKAGCEVQIRLRRRNRKGGNKYVLTCGAVLGGRIIGSNSHTTICTPLYKKMKAKSYLKAVRPKILSGDLSQRGPPDGFGPEAVYLELVNVGIHEKIARALTFDDRNPFESAVQAINNAKILRAVVWKRSLDVGLPRPKFNLAGYVVRALNGARKEGKIVGTTKLFREADELYEELKAREARRGRWKPLSEAQFERRRRALIRSLGLTA